MRVSVDALSPGVSPRFVKEDEEHIRRLAETDDELPPILVHRQGMRIIDGLHRYRAAILRGQTSISVKFFDGSDEEAFIHGVKTNVTHGLPLSLAERKVATEHIVRMCPQLSDRAIAGMVGLSATTVAVVRNRSGVQNDQSNTRIGRDGRVRPNDAEERRRRALDVIRRYPEASIREIARAAGVSVGTAHSLRAGTLKKQAEPAGRAQPEPDSDPGRAGTRPSQEPGRGERRGPGCGASLGEAPDTGAGQGIGTNRGAGEREGSRAAPRADGQDRDTAAAPDIPAPAADDTRAGRDAVVTPARTLRAGPWKPKASSGDVFACLENLQRDPSLRFTERGRAVLVWLRRRVITCGEGERELSNIPPHLLPVIANLALECADEWRQLADELQARLGQVGP
ncbi:ParB/RepB/Spo0J family partition protein [Streptomyces sp. DW26H14]|uniref:ParB/RepB/Spo0J family partition protein n=1 Tax=Streptomyces sp. DW26H14 TaxID=3435395 RepID=UPI00403DE654